MKLHRCSATWVRLGHPCWTVESALRDQGIEYERVLGPLRKSKRTELQAWSGQSMYPVLELEDGTFYRAESKAMAAKIRAGELGVSAAGPASG
jgi:glutathione S-transferase